MKKYFFLTIASLIWISSYGQTDQYANRLLTTGNNVVNPADPEAADIVIGSVAGTRHDGSIMWWSNGSASRISSTNDVFYMSVWNTTNANIGLSATTGGPSYFQGNVGIGTISPGSKLDVTGGNINVYPTSNYLTATTARQITIGEATNNPTYKLALGYYQDAGTGVWTGVVQSTQASAGSNLLFNPIGGNVGIGVTNPQNKLDVNGTIHFRQVNVDLTGWPDYVFKPTYHLLTLADVKAYIDKNHNLPEMPSEQQVAKDGINLGEMNKLLTKKVEELTLYLIEKDNELKIEKGINLTQDNRIRLQENKLEKMSAQLETLTKQLKKLIK